MEFGSSSRTEEFKENASTETGAKPQLLMYFYSLTCNNFNNTLNFEIMSDRKVSAKLVDIPSRQFNYCI